MPRAWTPDQQSAVMADAVRTALLITVQYDEGPIRLTDYGHDVEIDGFTWLNTGLMSVSTITETGALEISSVAVEISAITPGIVAAFLLYDHFNRPLVVSRALLNQNGQMLGVLTLFDGLISAASVSDAAPGGQPIVRVDASSHFGDLDQKNGRYTNSASQTDLFPDDKGFDHVNDLADPLIWGRPTRID